MPIAHAPVLSRVLAHGRDHDAVLKMEIPNTDRLKERWLSHDDLSYRDDPE
jgi:hypothetical protein